MEIEAWQEKNGNTKETQLTAIRLSSFPYSFLSPVALPHPPPPKKNTPDRRFSKQRHVARLG